VIQRHVRGPQFLLADPEIAEGKYCLDVFFKMLEFLLSEALNLSLSGSMIEKNCIKGVIDLPWVHGR
jgi:hypothetical protein